MILMMRRLIIAFVVTLLSLCSLYAQSENPAGLRPRIAGVQHALHGHWTLV